MKRFSSIPRLVVIAGTLLACSASSGPAGEAVGDNGGSSGDGSGGSIPTSGTGGTSGTAGTIPGSGGTIPTSGTGGSAANECGVQTFDLERKPAEVLLVLDRSASMKDPPEETTETQPKWALLIPALLEVVQATGDTLSWGLKRFPEDGPEQDDAPACSAGSVTDTIDVEIAENNTQAMVDGINATNDGGDGTPTGDAMKQAVAYLESRAGLNDYNRYVLLATDGEPSCINVTATSAGQEGQEEARPYAVAAIDDAVSKSFRTFVVGIGTNNENAKATLNAMALAGGVPAACANPLDDCFYLGNSREQLTEELLGIATNIATCTFMLTARPPDVNNVRVTLDGERVIRDMAKANGWEYQDDGQTIIEVYGEACEAIKNSGAANVQIVFGCPDVDVR